MNIENDQKKSPKYSHFAAIGFCIFAALCSAWLSGINFPEQNNKWQIPVVLDFANSAEGPHDAYSQSFANFISVFWLFVRSFTTESNIAPVFVTIQLVGNALLALAIYSLMVTTTRAKKDSALVTGFLCFCYGLWGPTQLGFSEVFVTYATHTQYAVSLSLFAFALIITRRPLWAALLLGLAANVNLFMSVWAAVAAGFALLLLDRRITVRHIGFGAIYLVLALPVAIWGLTANAGTSPPVEFLKDFLAGHVYGLRYPRALLHTLALTSAAILAVGTAHRNERITGLFAVILGCGLTLFIAVIMPYITDMPQLLLLHPLRFVSIVMPMIAVCAGVLLIRAWRSDDRSDLFPAALALAGFMIKLPVLSILGFVLLIPSDRRGLRITGGALVLISLIALFFPLPFPADIMMKTAIGFGLICALLATTIWLEPDASHPLWPGLAALVGAFSLLLFVPRNGDMVVPALIVSTAIFLAVSPFLAKRLQLLRPLALAAVIGIVPLLMLGGLINGARHRFAPAPSEQQQAFLAAQYWARENTPRDAMFMPAGVEDDFALFSRRPVWWEASQAAAILWSPGFHSSWACRKAALKEADQPDELVALAQQQGIRYIVTKASAANDYPSTRAIYRNSHYAILDAPVSTPMTTPICP